jgi:predicted HAD superfamily Cof-like phosphohydrolase
MPLPDLTQFAEAKLGEFFDKFDPPKDFDFWLSLVDEETGEVIEAYSHYCKEACDLLYVLAGARMALEKKAQTEPLTGEQGAILDRAMKTMFIIDQQGLDRPEVSLSVFKAVHDSNMSKVDDAGNPIRHPKTGKVMKGPNYRAPDIENILFGGEV